MRIRIATILLLFVSCFTAHGQELINGMVADSATFAPLPYVNVFIKHKTKGTITDTHGDFRLVVEPTDTLVFSFVGYKTLEISTFEWQPSVIMLTENPTVLRTVTIEGARIDPYEGMFDEENAMLEQRKRDIKFYYSKRKKQKIKLNHLAAENLRVQTYVDVVIQNETTKNTLMKNYQLSEQQYYDILSKFNAQNYMIMYYLTAGELVTLLNNFFAQQTRK